MVVAKEGNGSRGVSYCKNLRREGRSRDIGEMGGRYRKKMPEFGVAWASALWVASPEGALGLQEEASCPQRKKTRPQELVQLRNAVSARGKTSLGIGSEPIC